ncbi:hypothetical protein V6N13_048481 [Hibiscus sabdariffa]|uniref:Uncharacterized protein n=1 Tax=Hibiscus sabdariffa TaxID=183260 RepID=A0ABR2F7B3_9ROSI
MEASGQTEARKVQGNIQHIPSRRKQGCQCTGRARQQEQGACPVYRTPNPIRECVTRRITSKYGRGPAPQRATNNAPASQKQAGHLGKPRERHFRGRHQGLAEGVKQPMEASGQTKARKGQGSIQRIPSRRKQGCQCTGRARQQEQGGCPVYRMPNPIRGCITRREPPIVDEASRSKPAPPRETLNRKAAPNGIRDVHHA